MSAIDTDIVRRPIERYGICRGCGEELEKGTEIIYTYSFSLRGMSIIFCLDCAKKIGELVADEPS